MVQLLKQFFKTFLVASLLMPATLVYASSDPFAFANNRLVSKKSLNEYIILSKNNLSIGHYVVTKNHQNKIRTALVGINKVLISALQQRGALQLIAISHQIDNKTFEKKAPLTEMGSKQNALKNIQKPVTPFSYLQLPWSKYSAKKWFLNKKEPDFPENWHIFVLKTKNQKEMRKQSLCYVSLCRTYYFILKSSSQTLFACGNYSSTVLPVYFAFLKNTRSSYGNYFGFTPVLFTQGATINNLSNTCTNCFYYQSRSKISRQLKTVVYQKKNKAITGPLGYSQPLVTSTLYVSKLQTVVG